MTEQPVGQMVTCTLFTKAGKTLKGELTCRRLTWSAVWRTDHREASLEAGAPNNATGQARGDGGLDNLVLWSECLCPSKIHMLKS